MYSIKSYVPHPLMMNILPSIHVWLRGAGHTTEITGLNAAKTYQIGLQLRCATDCDYIGNILSVSKCLS